MELKIEPLGRKHREKFLKSCTETLARNVQQQSPGVDEVLALRMVKLTQFVLEACPREQAEEIVTLANGALASLIFSELTAFLSRGKKDAGIVPSKGMFLKRTCKARSFAIFFLTPFAHLPPEPYVA
jgi:hypothetical protein